MVTMVTCCCCSGNWEWSETERAERAAVRDTSLLAGVEDDGLQEVGVTKSSVLRCVTKFSSCLCLYTYGEGCNWGEEVRLSVPDCRLLEVTALSGGSCNWDEAGIC